MTNEEAIDWAIKNGVTMNFCNVEDKRLLVFSSGVTYCVIALDDDVIRRFLTVFAAPAINAIKKDMENLSTDPSTTMP